MTHEVTLTDPEIAALLALIRALPDTAENQVAPVGRTEAAQCLIPTGDVAGGLPSEFPVDNCGNC